MTNEQLQAAIAAAKQRILEAEEAKRARMQLATAITAPRIPDAFSWNVEQQLAIDYAMMGRSFCLIGAAGTGKTTTLKGALKALLSSNRLAPLHQSTKWLTAGTPGIALISYTRRAVRNIAKQMPPELRSHCLTYHKLMEYAPNFYDIWDDEQQRMRKTVRFEPSYDKMNRLPSSLRLVIVDEASMLSIDYFSLLKDALAPDCQFIFLGDLNQLPPVYGQAILGQKLLELPIIELTKVYRQALESPIISLALAVKNNSFDLFHSDLNTGTFLVNGKAHSAYDPEKIKVTKLTEKLEIFKEGRGKVTLHPWKKVLDKEDGCWAMAGQLRKWITEGVYDPDQDLVLCPWNKSFGSIELNKEIADFLGKQRGEVVHEVIAGFLKHYFAVGDRLLVDKTEARILAIDSNPRYLGTLPQLPSKELNRWGMGSHQQSALDENLTDEQIDTMLEAAADVEDRTHEASHCIRVWMEDIEEERVLSKAGEINLCSFAYVITVHKAQGSECRRVFFITHDCHAAMCSRELVYTAITRAAEELYIVMPPTMLAKSASKPRIKGDTLQAKLDFFNSRMQEKAE